MYLIIRCPGCLTFTYVDRYQQWKLCPVCGESIKVSNVPAYIDVKTHRDADSIVRELEKYLHKNKRNNLTDVEQRKLNADYAQWMRKNVSDL